MKFKLKSKYSPTGDQPEAINELSESINSRNKHNVLLGVTGSGKTFTIANVIERLNRPVLVLSHNKTLAAQLFSEFKQFFPENAVEYFISYYDYYQPEAYMPVTDTYIEKDLSINEEIERFRLSATSSLLSGRRDVIVVSSVSCLYGIGNPDDFHANSIHIEAGSETGRNEFLRKLVDAMYSRNEEEFKHGTFRVKGDTVDIFLPYSDMAYRILFWGEEIDEIESFDPYTGDTIDSMDSALIYPANIFVTTKERQKKAIRQIELDLGEQIDYFKNQGKHLEAKRIEDRVTYDLEMIRELGYCPGIENYSRYFDGREPGSRPFCLLDYFPDDFITVIDESHVTIPQIHAMYGGDNSRKTVLVEHGFRLPAAIDNRPLKFNEFENLVGQVVYMSATPANYELEKAEGHVIDQVVRPTGLLDPEIEVRPTLNQIDDLIGEINERAKNNERVLVTTLTKRMAEELTKYLTKMSIDCRYIHSDIDTLERVEIMEDLRKGKFKALIGVNLLREGLDLPEVSLVAILDADKEGFLRSERALTQTAGRAARNVNGKVVMYADKVTRSMQNTIDETNRRREKQLAYNEKHGLTPQQIEKAASKVWDEELESESTKIYNQDENVDVAADPVVQYMSKNELEKAIEKLRDGIKKASKEYNYVEAARLRDEMYQYQELLENKQ